MTEAEYLAKLESLAPHGCTVSRIGLEVYRGREEARMWILRMVDRIGLAHEILANLAERKVKPMSAYGQTEALREVTAERDQLRQQLDSAIAGKLADLEQLAGEILDAEIRDRKPAEYAFQDALALPGLCERIIKERDRLRALLSRLARPFITGELANRGDGCNVTVGVAAPIPGGLLVGELRAALAPKV